MTDFTLPPEPPAEVVQLGVKFRPPVAAERFLVVDHGKCQHWNGPYLVDETLEEVTCGQCKEKLSPMWVLKQMAHKETRWHDNMARYQHEMQRLAERSKTKCQHCQKMTRISRA